VTIKRKLFLAFLLLAFLPTSGLIWLSYYLATEGSKLVAAPGVSETLAAGDSLAMWALAQEQERLAVDLSNSATDSAFDLVLHLQADSVVTTAGRGEAELRHLQSELVGSEANSGRLLLDERLLIWHRGEQAGEEAIVARLLPAEYFRLANRLLEGQTKYRSISRTLLPVGQDLLFKIAIGSTLVFLILSLLVAQMLSHSLAAPLGRLVDATQRVSRGDLSHRIPGATRDEVGRLVDNFNRMTAELEQTTKNLLIAEREMAWKETARTIAHEIKNLLTPVNLTLFKIQQRLSGAPNDSGPELDKSVAALAEEIEAVAELARQFALFAHPTRLARSEVKLAEVVEAAVALHAAESSEHDLKVTVSQDLPTVSADRDLLRRALSNLIKNALEATPYGGQIVITCTPQEGQLLLSVRDDGPGADEAIDLALPYVTTKKSGTGLGLAIVKKVCEAHGWLLSYGNADPGFEVEITIPSKHDS
jgi:nitrogen fixation/metabolism regulation signal transduction histidine kinase